MQWGKAEYMETDARGTRWYQTYPKRKGALFGIIGTLREGNWYVAWSLDGRAVSDVDLHAALRGDGMTMTEAKIEAELMHETRPCRSR